MNPMPDFDQKQLDTEWAALNAIREMLLISGRSTAESTYDESLALATELLPKLFNPDKWPDAETAPTTMPLKPRWFMLHGTLRPNLVSAAASRMPGQ